ncbi:hypothetical protein [Candidatus Nitrososphaera sp. FF02]|uniref:hypothetical protein n=1 Tax=Candidatus Nitrososphaera sp. FF02 TaxID=3398226 RepID=UPI0039EBCBAD
MQQGIFRRRTILATLVAFSLVMMVTMPASRAFAAQPYYGGATYDIVTPVAQIIGWSDFDGTTGSVQDHTHDVFTTAGWNISTQTPTGSIYQSIATLLSNNNIIASNQAHGPPGNAFHWGCYLNVSSCTVLGTVSNLDYIYHSMFWTGSFTTANLYLEGHRTNGAVVYKLDTMNPSSYSDSANRYSAGSFFGFNPTNGNFLVKFLQFGVESDTPTTGWKISQYDITYYAPSPVGTVNLADRNAFSNGGTVEHTDTIGQGSVVTYYLNSGYQFPLAIGGTDYNVNADYHLKNSAIPDGKVVWYRGTMLPPETALWGDGAVHIVSKDLAGNTVPGLSVTLRDASDNIIASGYTPMTVLVPTSGTYYIHYNNYGNYFFTLPVSASHVVDYNVYSWGGRVQANLSHTKSLDVVAQYYNHLTPGNYGKMTMTTQTTGGGALGMFVSIKDPSGTIRTKGYTPFTVGVPINQDMTNTFTNWSTINYLNATPTPSGIEISDNAYSWGGEQKVRLTSAGGTYSDVGIYDP